MGGEPERALRSQTQQEAYPEDTAQSPGGAVPHIKRATRLRRGDMGGDGKLARNRMRTLGVSDDDSGREKLRPVRHEPRSRPRVVDGAVERRRAQLQGLEVGVRDGE